MIRCSTGNAASAASTMRNHSMGSAAFVKISPVSFLRGFPRATASNMVLFLKHARRSSHFCLSPLPSISPRAHTCVHERFLSRDTVFLSLLRTVYIGRRRCRRLCRYLQIPTFRCRRAGSTKSSRSARKIYIDVTEYYEGRNICDSHGR